MTKRIPFDEAEMKVIGQHINFTSACFGPPVIPMYNTPITPKENVMNVFRRDGSAMWFPTTTDFAYVESRANPDHIARAEICDMGPKQPLEEKGGKDLFGVEWQFVEVAGGSMEVPGAKRLLEDVNDWKENVKFPDVEALDWEANKMNAVLNDSKRVLGITFQNGMFERLISFMGFEDAAVALIDEDQKDAIHELFDRLADMYIEMIEKYMEVLNLESVTFHDDWGSQRAPFFSEQVCTEMIAPHIKKIADFCHSKGMIFNHHSCVKNELLVPSMLAEGDDMWWPQDMNDIDTLREKYGDKLVLSVVPPAVAEDASDEEIEAAAKAFVDKYAPDYFEKPIIVMAFFATQRLVDAIYRQSRIALCGKKED